MPVAAKPVTCVSEGVSADVLSVCRGVPVFVTELSADISVSSELSELFANSDMISV